MRKICESVDYLLGPKPGSRIKTGHKVVACIPAWNEEASIAQIIVNTLNYVDEVYVCARTEIHNACCTRGN